MFVVTGEFEGRHHNSRSSRQVNGFCFFLSLALSLSSFSHSFSLSHSLLPALYLSISRCVSLFHSLSLLPLSLSPFPPPPPSPSPILEYSLHCCRNKLRFLCKDMFDVWTDGRIVRKSEETETGLWRWEQSR